MKLIKKYDNLYIPENFDTNHVYYADEKGKQKYTGITTVLGVLNKPALVPWAARMAVEYIENHAQVVTQPGAEPWTYFINEKLLEEAKTAYAKKRDKGGDEGTRIHELVELYVNEAIANHGGKAQPVEDPAIQGFVDWAIKEDIKFISAEIPLVSDKHWLAGTADLLFEKGDRRYVGDIKTFKKIWDRTPFYQCAGYAMMWEEMNRKPQKMYDYERGGSRQYNQIDGYCIINLPKERAFIEDADIMWSFDTEGDTEAFLSCLKIYRRNAEFVSPKVPYQSKK